MSRLSIFNEGNEMGVLEARQGFCMLIFTFSIYQTINLTWKDSYFLKRSAILAFTLLDKCVYLYKLVQINSQGMDD